MNKSKRHLGVMLSAGILAIGLAGYASAMPANPSDPYENFNRSVYKFNDALDKTIIKPVAKVYHAILPNFVTHRVTNFFSNLNEIPTVFNDLLQGSFYQATSDTWRFGINSTAGLLGMFDIASHMGLAKNDQDFGLTLAKWGYTSSNYLVLPFLGPSTVRDAFGTPVDYASSVYPYMHDNTTSYALYGTSVINTRANLLNYDQVLAQAFDPYVFVRNAYMQRRNSEIETNKHRNMQDILTTNAQNNTTISATADNSTN